MPSGLLLSSLGHSRSAQKRTAKPLGWWAQWWARSVGMSGLSGVSEVERESVFPLEDTPNKFLRILTALAWHPPCETHGHDFHELSTPTVNATGGHSRQCHACRICGGADDHYAAEEQLFASTGCGVGASGGRRSASAASSAEG